jgi:hypothetical protein
MIDGWEHGRCCGLLAAFGALDDDAVLFEVCDQGAGGVGFDCDDVLQVVENED